MTFLFNTRGRKLLSLPRVILPKLRTSFSESKDPVVTSIRSFKRYFAIGLFGVTLAVAVVFKQRRKREWENLVSKTNRVGQFGKLILYEYEHYMLPKPVLELLDKIEKFEFRTNDIVITSFPKTEIVWLLTNDLDFLKATKEAITDRVPYLEWPTPGLDSISKSRKNPRLIKTHLPVSILVKDKTPKPRIISITREPKDVLVSYYHFSRMNNLIGFEGHFPEFLDAFLQDKVAYGPIYRFYVELDDLSHKNNSDQDASILVVKYEDLKNNFEGVIGTLCSFLGRDSLSEKEMKRLKEHCSFENMKMNPSVNYEHWNDLGVRKKGESEFMRKGVVGDWETHFSPGQKERFDDWLTAKRNALKPIDEIDVKINLV